MARYALILLLAGCTPFVEYEHLSDPRIKDDGYDLICGGGETGDQLTASVGICHNISPNKGEYVKINIRYRPTA